MDWLFALIPTFVLLHGPGGQEIRINIEEIASIRAPVRREHFAPEIHCLLIMTSGRFNGVMETCTEVIQSIADIERKKPE